MNFENYLSLKKALRIAMPCLALSFFVSCSNEETTGASNETTLPATNLTLTATVPVAKESSSTRVGIKDDASASPNYVWIEGETLTLYWKNLHDSEEDKVIVYKVEGVSNDGKSCTMNPVESTTLENGFYKIHSLSPHTEFNFVDGALTAIIDLGNQNQPSDAVDHNYLSDKLYQYATTVVQVYEGAIISGTTNLPFEFITSLLRVRVVNNTGWPIDVKKVKLSYSTENNPQFYSKGIFTANEFVGPHSFEADPGAILNDLSITTNHELANDETFDVYMSFFPTVGYNSESQEKLNMDIEYIISDMPAEFHRSAVVSSPTFVTNTQSCLMFDAGDVFNVTLTILKSDAEPYVPLFLPALTQTTLGDYVYSVTAVKPLEDMIVVGDKVFLFNNSNFSSACADGWTWVHPNVMAANNVRILASSGDISFGGYATKDGFILHPSTAFLYNRTDEQGVLCSVAGTAPENWNTAFSSMFLPTASVGLQVLCRRAN